MNKQITPTKRSPKKRTSTADSKAPWEQENPKADAKHTKLSPQAKASAKSRAKKAGRPYPNLIDNMSAAAGSKK